MRWFRWTACSCLTVVFCTLAWGAERATLVREAVVYLSPDANSSKLANAERGRELVILETSRNWIHVEALLGPARTPDAAILDAKAITYCERRLRMETKFSTARLPIRRTRPAADMGAAEPRRMLCACIDESMTSFQRRHWQDKRFTAQPIFAGRLRKKMCSLALPHGRRKPTCAKA